jgi:ubiquinone/menaquinone biosynthesis C-methylase UbiE
MLSTAARATTTPSECYEGSIDTYLDLLNPIQISDESTTDGERLVTSTNNQLTWLMRQATPYLPPPVRSALASTASGDEYIPMRDLFTSPAVSFAYERGWRQGFAQAGFPGPDIEAKMASEYFAPAIASVPANKTSVLVDMSCATGLFTRRFASMDIADRVIGCDYSDSMLTEARRRIQTDPGLSRSRGLDLVRLDVGQIPMQDNSVDALHAGAAMHCWPDLDAAASEIYRVLKPGGRYFASTFLSRYFATLSGMDGQANTPPSQQAFQYFDSIDSLSSLLERGGFSREKILIEVIGNGTLAHHHK